eukprot:12743825-Alexandrium_andersonii.AAC.1
MCGIGGAAGTSCGYAAGALELPGPGRATSPSLCHDADMRKSQRQRRATAQSFANPEIPWVT